MSINISTKKTRYIDYDYEDFYDTPINSIEDAEIEKLLKGNKIKYHYTTKTIKSGNQFEVEIYPLFSKKNFDKYQPKKKPTRLTQKYLNDKNARKYFIRLVNANFSKNDWVIHLTYSNNKLPKSIKDAERMVYNYIRKINRRRKKLGLENAKYNYVTEYDPEKKIRCHHHLIIEDGIDRKIMKKLWTNGTRTKIEELEPDDAWLTGLAMYLSKDPKGKKRWKPSKNLKKPVERKSYTVFSNKKIRNMIDDQSLVSVYVNRNYKAKQYLQHEVRYNKVNHMFYIYVRMRTKERMNI